LQVGCVIQDGFQHRWVEGEEAGAGGHSSERKIAGQAGQDDMRGVGAIVDLGDETIPCRTEKRK